MCCLLHSGTGGIAAPALSVALADDAQSVSLDTR